MLELRPLAFDDFVLEAVGRAVLLDQVEETPGKVMRMDVDGVVRVLAHAAPFFRILPRWDSRTPIIHTASRGEIGKWKSASASHPTDSGFRASFTSPSRAS